MSGLFIAIEGIDGSGTTTQAGRLRDVLNASGERSHFTCEPTEGPVGAAIRLALRGRLNLSSGVKTQVADEESLFALLFAADRMDHLLNEIIPAVEENVHVITDRYYLSSFAYQSTGCELAWLRQLNSRCRRPDVTFLLDLDPEVSMERIGRDRHGRERYEKLDQLKAVRANYLTAAAQLIEEGENIIQLSAAEPIDQVHGRILKTVLEMIQ